MLGLSAHAVAIVCRVPGAHVLVLGGGGGLAALLAARAGAGRVTAVERGRMLFRMAAQALAANAAAPGAPRVTLLDQPLRSVGVAGAAPAPGCLPWLRTLILGLGAPSHHVEHPNM